MIISLKYFAVDKIKSHEIFLHWELHANNSMNMFYSNWYPVLSCWDTPNGTLNWLVRDSGLAGIDRVTGQFEQQVSVADINLADFGQKFPVFQNLVFNFVFVIRVLY